MEQYANDWGKSASWFYDNKDYEWMCNHIETYPKVLEIGCGTGHSSLSIIQRGHDLLAVDVNEYCIEKAKLLLEENGYKLNSLTGKNKIEFLSGDISEDTFIDQLLKYDFDVVICWNVGAYLSSSDICSHYYKKLKKDGFPVENIRAYFESYYGELIQRCSCKIAESKNIPFHIVDRGVKPIAEATDLYFSALKKEYHFDQIFYDSRLTNSKSSGGRTLVSNQNILSQDNVVLYLSSILMTQ